MTNSQVECRGQACLDMTEARIWAWNEVTNQRRKICLEKCHSERGLLPCKVPEPVEGLMRGSMLIVFDFFVVQFVVYFYVLFFFFVMNLSLGHFPHVGAFCV